MENIIEDLCLDWIITAVGYYSAISWCYGGMWDRLKEKQIAVE